MNFQQYAKSYNYNPVLSAPELSDQITEQAFNTSTLLSNMGQQIAENPSYRNVFVRHPSVSRVNEGDTIPSSTAQTYHTTDSDFTKIASKIEFTNEVLDFSKFDIEANTAMLVGNVTANEIATIAVEDLKTRETLTPINDPLQVGYGEDILKLKSGISDSWGLDALSIYTFISDAIKNISDVYDSNSKLFCSKNNLIDFSSLTQTSALGGNQVWLVQNGMILGRYEIVVCDQLPDGTMYFGDMESAFDVVALQGNQTVDNQTSPDLLKITQTNKYAVVAKDSSAIVAMVQEV
ncbi:phage major capsid protein [Vibrio sp. T187]|uniref:phage major capsid protein n=1 Tax=Vibrio TaxID=662 RepID=UPI0010CA1930|nr:MULTISPECIES: phage major capsid protein [Vibrio]MBW3696459.1 phage major capsid protein [Vibrio sp. T187]